uniref:follistatin-related protein 3 isoform X3 n=1 Tax=Nyctereutes procyonoides TaxID=34880 RepID=UPI0024440142|nr:follistatin-related protein 3 isoform X3 [Nyctereutes procyonoides]
MSVPTLWGFVAAGKSLPSSPSVKWAPVSRHRGEGQGRLVLHLPGPDAYLLLFQPLEVTHILWLEAPSSTFTAGDGGSRTPPGSQRETVSARRSSDSTCVVRGHLPIQTFQSPGWGAGPRQGQVSAKVTTPSSCTPSLRTWVPSLPHSPSSEDPLHGQRPRTGQDSWASSLGATRQEPGPWPPGRVGQAERLRRRRALGIFWGRLSCIRRRVLAPAGPRGHLQPGAQD